MLIFAAWLVTEGLVWPEEPTPPAVMDVTSQGSDHQPREGFDSVDGPDQDLSFTGSSQALHVPSM